MAEGNILLSTAKVTEFGLTTLKKQGSTVDVDAVPPTVTVTGAQTNIIYAEDTSTDEHT